MNSQSDLSTPRPLRKSARPGLLLPVLPAGRGMGRAGLAIAVFSMSVLFFATLARSNDETVWPDLRDGVLHVRSTEPVAIRCQWKSAWSAESHAETLYFLDPSGGLLDRKRIGPSESRGECVFRTSSATGDHRLEIPGYSFRNYSLLLPKGTLSVFEPVRHHFSMSVSSGRKFYFRVPPNASFALGAKYHEGPKAITVRDPGGNTRNLSLTDHGTKYPQHDVFPIQNAAGGVWQLEMKGSGKIGFWLDGVSNCFALRPEDVFEPSWIPGEVKVEVSAEKTGRSPMLGATMSFANLPKAGYDLLDSLGMTAGNHYAFQDALTMGDTTFDWRDDSWLRIYEKQMRITESVSIFTPNRRLYANQPPPLRDLDNYVRFMDSYIEHHRVQAGLKLPYVAFLDEPNFRFASQADYEAFFHKIASDLRQSPRDAVRSVKIAAPESSGFVNGPMKPDADRRVGIVWAEALLKKDWPLVDALSWHEWMVRDLIATEWYAESVEQTWAMMQRCAPAGSAPKDLIISQTNISSGSDISPYEEDTFFAALWWASAVIHGATPGKLKMMIWFPAIDAPAYPKGLVCPDRSKPPLKPVGHAMRFINRSLLPNVLKLRNESVEVAALATVNETSETIRVLFVNKFPRQQVLSLNVALPPALAGVPVRWTLAKLDKTLKEEAPDEGISESKTSFAFQRTIQGETIYRLEIEKR